MASTWKEVALSGDLTTLAKQSAEPTVGQIGIGAAGEDSAGQLVFSSVPAGKILVGDSSNNAQIVAVSGDMSMSDAGELTIVDNKVDASALADNAVGTEQLATQAAGDMLYYGVSGNPAILAGNTGAANEVLTWGSNGPSWTTAGTASDVSVALADDTSTYNLVFTTTSAAGAADLIVDPAINPDDGLTFDSNLNKLTTRIFEGALSGNASSATKVKISASDTSSNHYITFGASLADASEQSLYSDDEFYYNPNTNTLGVRNLTVSGTTTTISSTDLIVSDKTILLASGSTNASISPNAGIVIDCGAGDSEDTWQPRVTWKGNTSASTLGWHIAGTGALTNDIPTAASTSYNIAPMLIDNYAAPVDGTTNVGVGAMYLTTGNKLFIQTSA